MTLDRNNQQLLEKNILGRLSTLYFHLSAYAKGTTFNDPGGGGNRENSHGAHQRPDLWTPRGDRKR